MEAAREEASSSRGVRYSHHRKHAFPPPSGRGQAWVFARGKGVARFPRRFPGERSIRRQGRGRGSYFNL
ncbi:Hypothetical protein Minf_2141 [Methylacidiphilum infernorum V4]|uniref:Uncharacterized protein n=1 Tax=Methylacidiphilum infernorum (isolate V4) TaxID=481448 RepID=B3DZA3_METI4|nr:Hypothetical protein Minf_2141 [Methylacidiphilum infernorum V4]